MVDASVYVRLAADALPRLAGLLDRNEGAKTFGCFHRVYWHDKLTDFPCSHCQIGVHPMAALYAKPHPENPFYRKPKLLRWTVAGLRFWASIQQKNGSFDEHYPGERSYGAAAWTLAAATGAYRMIRDEMPEADREPVETAVEKAARFLARSDEPGLLTNHQAIAAAALQNAGDLLQNRDFHGAALERIDLTLRRQDPEGWFIEYDLADLGYQTTSLGFLSQLLGRVEEPRLIDALARGLEFASYFLHPDGSFGGFEGSRSTHHLWPVAPERLAAQDGRAASLARAAREGLERGMLLRPQDVDDKHLPVLMMGLLEGFENHRGVLESSLLPSQGPPFQRAFPRARLVVSKGSGFSVVGSPGKGGLLKVFAGKSFADAGWIVFHGRELWTTHGVNPGLDVEIRENGFRVRGHMLRVRPEVLTWTQLILTRTVPRMTPDFLSRTLKGVLVRSVVTRSRPAPAQFTREVRWAETVEITDRLHLPGPATLQRLDSFYPRFVPCGRYAQRLELEGTPEPPIEVPGTTVFRRVFHPDTGAVEDERLPGAG